MMSNVEEMKKFIKKNSYLLIYPTQQIELFGNLRSLGEAISIDSSTISKKLSRGENYFFPKGGEYIFYIKKLS
jgi:hypothetical protein|tara:strand:+ start:10 stop:228 length:219 start_codon:yes stop_codon:yes gene_type:complete